MRVKPKKRWTFSLLIALLFVIYPISASAKEDAIPSITVDVILQDNGSALITETWQVKNVYSGTEYYKAIENAETLNVHSLTVQDETGKIYETLDIWDTDRSREEKSGTCGVLVTDDGYELCWGVGEYGDHIYTIQYTLDGLVKDYGDYAGFYHQFIGELSSAPEKTALKIQKENVRLVADNARIWAYGFTGDVKFGNDGTLNVFSSEELSSNDYVNILCRFEKSLFSSLPQENKTFEDLQNMADSANSNLGLYIIVGGLFAGVVLAITLSIFFHGRYKLANGEVKRLPKKKDLEINTTVPFFGNIPGAAAIFSLLGKEISFEKLISAYLVRWQQAGYVQVEKQERQTHRHNQAEEAIIFKTKLLPKEPVEQVLYQILSRYADDNGVLWAHTMEKHAETLYDKLDTWHKEVIQEGNQFLIGNAMAVRIQKYRLHFTEEGFQQAISVLGFQKYLYEMRKPNNQQVPERDLWGDYLVFAILFGIEQEILKSLQTVDPEYYNDFSSGYGCDAYSMMYFLTITNHISSTPAPAQADGTGGSVSSVGGGGFSGGGGGGSR